MVTTSSRRYVTLYDGVLSQAAGNKIVTGMNKELMDDLLDSSDGLVTEYALDLISDGQNS